MIFPFGPADKHYQKSRMASILVVSPAPTRKLRALD
jgi:hypothetical protein